MNLTTGDQDTDIENVTRELKDLKDLFGLYEDRALELQTELKLAHDEFCNLVVTRESTLVRTDREELGLQVPQDEWEECLQRKHQKDIAIAKLRKENQLYKKKLDCAFRQLEKEKQHRAKIVDDCRQTSNQAVQTVAQKPEGDFTIKRKPLIPGFEHKTQCMDENFSLALIDIAFHMHEQLSCYQASRTAEDRKHEAFIFELKKNYEKNLQELRRKYRIDLKSFRKKIEEAAEKHTNKLRKEGKDLRRRLLEAEAQQVEAKHTIRRLQLQLQLSSLGANTG
ncbi:hypothetical protein CRM22_007338 [Opisthorchis felineus]|uniref:Uncharacterized protein n=1 Tax=Opisthorchis felineus TaxID=147828 RepID=A0A4S2LPN6_OPIFE|nr:hypothetical protein CRM22_007338 [Opisthorchis felineus]